MLLLRSPNEKYAWIFETLDITPFLTALGKTSYRGAPETLNYRAMIYSLFIRIVERMPFIKDLGTRLNASEEFATIAILLERMRYPVKLPIHGLFIAYKVYRYLRTPMTALSTKLFKKGLLRAAM